MHSTSPNWLLLKVAAEDLTRRGQTLFTRQQLIAEAQAKHPERPTNSLNPMIQGITVNLRGGAPGGLGQDMFFAVARGLFELFDPQRHPAKPVQVAVPDVAATPITQAIPGVAHSPDPNPNPDAPLILVSCVKSKAAFATIARGGWSDSARTWGRDRNVSPQARQAEYPLEAAVSRVIGAMPFLWLEADDDPGPTSVRADLERNAIALLSNADMPESIVDPPSRW
jgi:hypothetical protein